ncbi:MAG: hypothetical protein WC705_01985 [Candidatus Paceibacterota bacterium]|jgi:predicted GIY-YIG superfamily endonuclease
MPIKIEGFQFWGPYYHSRRFDKSFGCVYVILNNRNQVVDVGETNDVNSRLLNHERKMCWYRNGVGETGLYIYISNDQNFRLLLEKLIRNKYHPLCGDR